MNGCVAMWAFNVLSKTFYYGPGGIRIRLIILRLLLSPTGSQQSTKREQGLTRLFDLFCIVHHLLCQSAGTVGSLGTRAG